MLPGKYNIIQHHDHFALYESPRRVISFIMVFLAMTPALVEVVQLYVEKSASNPVDNEPLLQDPAEGNPISHSQIIEISKWISSSDGKSHFSGNTVPTRLNDLLKGCRIYQPPKEQPKQPVWLSMPYKLVETQRLTINRHPNIRG
jgi:hypothetical protein